MPHLFTATVYKKSGKNATTMKTQAKLGSFVQGKIFIGAAFIVVMTFLHSCQKETSALIENDTPLTPQITFQKTYGGANVEDIWGVQQTTAGGYIMIGSTTSFGAGDENIYVINTDSAGKILWTKTYESPLENQGYNIKQTNDGGFILCGSSTSLQFFTSHIIKINAHGDVQWSKDYDELGCYEVEQSSDGGYMITGVADGFAGIQLIKTDDLGNIIWAKTYGGGNGGPIVKTNDGGYAVTGFTAFGVGDFDVLLIKTDGNGNRLWSKTYGGIALDWPISMKLTSDGGFIIAGWTTSFGAGDYDAYLIRIDPNGNLIWSKTFGKTGFEGAVGVAQTDDGGYILSGLTGDYANGYALIIKTDNSGNVTWSKTYGGGTEGYSYVHQTKDKGYIIVSTTSSFGAGNRDIYLVKTNDQGNSGCHESSFTPIVTTPATQVTIPNLSVWTGASSFTSAFTVGTGGTETTICYK
jgi:hypothetical protein